MPWRLPPRDAGDRNDYKLQPAGKLHYAKLWSFVLCDDAVWKPFVVRTLFAQSMFRDCWWAMRERGSLGRLDNVIVRLPLGHQNTGLVYVQLAQDVPGMSIPGPMDILSMIFIRCPLTIPKTGPITDVSWTFKVRTSNRQGVIYSLHILDVYLSYTEDFWISLACS